MSSPKILILILIFLGLNEFASAIERGYVKRNPFHNAMHAADVTQGFHFLASKTAEQIEKNEEARAAREAAAAAAKLAAAKGGKDAHVTSANVLITRFDSSTEHTHILNNFVKI